jgi:hypothetical protein
LFRGGGGHFRKTNLSLSLFYEALALSRAETKEGPLSLSLSRKGNARKERKKERKKERRRRRRDEKAKSVCRKKSVFSFENNAATDRFGN